MLFNLGNGKVRHTTKSPGFPATGMVPQQSLLQKGQTINVALKVFDSLTLLPWQGLGVTAV